MEKEDSEVVALAIDDNMPASSTNQSEEYFMMGNMTNFTYNINFRHCFSETFYRYMFSFIYVAIFTLCVVGNSLVLIVISRSARMKTRTNFFLANLATADLCVGVLCVLPNLLHFLYPGWLLGTVMCKIYYFAESFCFCASVLLLAVIALERYIAVKYPMKSMGLFTKRRMHTAQVLIWALAACYNIPLLFMFDTYTVVSPGGNDMVFCFVRDIINLRMYYTINFLMWYVFPLTTMCVVYAIISWTLWNSGGVFVNNSDHRHNSCPTMVTPMVNDRKSSGNVSMCSNSGRNCESGSDDGNDVADCGENDSTGADNGENDSLKCDRDENHGYSGRSNFAIGHNVIDHRCKVTNLCEEKYEYRYSGKCPEFPCHNLENTKNDSKVTDTDFQHNGIVLFKNCVTVMYAKSAQDKRQEAKTRKYFCDVGTERLKKTSQQKHSPFRDRRRCSKHGTNTYEMVASVRPLHRQSGFSRRISMTLYHTLAKVGSNRRSSRRSLYSDYASDVSTPGKNSVSLPSLHGSSRSTQGMSMRVLASRRKVIRLLIVVLLTFALCVLPHHVRLLMIYWNVYPHPSFGMSFFPPIAFVCLYLNSALNPVLYSLFSETFRHSLKECLRRPWHRLKSLIQRN